MNSCVRSKIGSSGAKRLAVALRPGSTIASINLSANELSSKCVAEVVQALQGQLVRRVQTVTTLILNSNQIGALMGPTPAGVVALCSLFRHQACQLTKLGLAHCGLQQPQVAHSLTLTFSHSHSLTHSVSHSVTLTLTFSQSIAHSLSLTLSLTLTLTLSRTLTRTRLLSHSVSHSVAHSLALAYSHTQSHSQLHTHSHSLILTLSLTLSRTLTRTRLLLHSVAHSVAHSLTLTPLVGECS